MIQLKHLIGLIGVTVLTGCGEHEQPPQAEHSLPPAEVQTGLVERRQEIRNQILPGTVYPSDSAVLASKIMATIEVVEVVVGESVEAGQLLIGLDAGEIQAQVEQAEAALAQLERNYAREKSLLTQSATTVESVRTLEDEIRLARARLAEATIMSSYTEIRSPFDGIVTSKEIRRGDLATPGTPLMTVEGKGSLEVHVQVPESLMMMDYGDEVKVQGKDAVYDGSLSEWSPAADPSSRTRLAKLQLPETAALRSGQYVHVQWPAEESESLWMPAEAVSRIGQIERVFVVEDDELALLLVRSGPVQGQSVQVLAGLNEGDRVVIAPSLHLRDGQPALLKP